MDEPAGHTPVLVRAVCDLLAVHRGETVLDATVGLGGHARLLAESLGSDGTLIGVDADPANLAQARKFLADLPCRVELHRANFVDLREVLRSLRLATVDVLFADLGVSSRQLDDPNRGFSFQHDGPLDMRIDPSWKETAADLVNRLKEKKLGDLLYHNAQEFAARRIAKRICEARRSRRITTTRRLADIVADAVGVDPASRKRKIHPATRTFLALRMAVNDEIPLLQALLEMAPTVLNPGGRIGIITFHSGEDRPVKLDFRRRKNEGVYSIETKKPITPDSEERKSNPRSRSAKLRVAMRLPEDAPEAGSRT